jgi:hypothetical protein
LEGLSVSVTDILTASDLTVDGLTQAQFERVAAQIGLDAYV